MANQIIIDIGAVANDGTGDPLRTAFNYVNNNFSNVWNTGLPESNVAFSGNKIITVNTNGNLVLAPNGVGKVIANVDIVPNQANVRNLGALTNRWSAVYTQYINVSGEVDFAGDVTIQGNLTVEGDTIQIGNITTDSKTIQLSNTASTANAANGSGITVGANDNIATMLYSSTSNTWVMNIGANITGNVTAPYFIGNGSQLTGITSYANANAVAYGQSGWAGNIIPAGNAVYSLGNATNQWNDLYVSNATIFMNNVPISLTSANVLTVNSQPVLINDSNTSITTTGNITADFFIGDGSQLSNVASTGNIAITGTDIAIADGAPETVINISPDPEGDAFIQIPNDATANTANLRVVNETGNVTVETNNGNNVWIFGYTGTLTAPGDVEIGTGNSGVQLRSNQTGTGIYATITNITNGSSTVVVTLADVEFAEGDQGTVRITGVVGETEANGFWGWQAVEVDQIQLYTNGTLTTPVDGTTWSAYVSGGLAVSSGYNELDIQGGIVSIISGAGKYWSFNPEGTTLYPTLTVTRGDRTGTLTGQALVFGDSTQEAIISTPNGTNDNNSSQRFVINPGAGAAGTSGEGGDIYLYAGRGGDAGGSGGDIKIRGGLGPADGAGGYLDIMGGEAAGNGSGGYIDIQGGQSANSTGGRIRIEGGQGINGAEANITGGTGSAGSGGAVNIAGGVSSNGIAEYGNVNITSGSSTWIFNNTGNLLLPGGGNIVLESGDGVIGKSGDDLLISWDNEELILRSVNGDVQLEAENDVEIRSGYNFGTGDYGSRWIFNDNGELQSIPQDNANSSSYNGGYIQFVGNSSGDGYGYTTIVLRPDETVGSDQNIVIDPTSPNHIHIRAGGTQDNSSAQLYLGGETSHFSVGAFTNPPVYIKANDNQWTYGTDGGLTVPSISTGGEGEQERAEIRGTRTIVGETGTWSTYIPGHTAFGNVAWTASGTNIQSARITFVIQTNGTAFNWEQFDVAVCKLDGANAIVSVSNRIRQNSAIDYTEVSAYETEGYLNVWLNPADGQTSGYVNYHAVEFSIMPD